MAHRLHTKGRFKEERPLVVARQLLFNGEKLKPGDPVPQAMSKGKRKTLFGTRHLTYAPDDLASKQDASSKPRGKQKASPKDKPAAADQQGLI